jgi:hypothetical protein
MSTRVVLEGKALPSRNTDNLTAICEAIVYKMWKPRRLITLWEPRPLTGIKKVKLTGRGGL